MHYIHKNLKNLKYILLLTIFISCSERVDLALDNDNKLQIKCILVPGQEITATLTTVTNFTNVGNIEYPENAKIYLHTEIDTPLEFKYDSERKLYYIPISHHTPRIDYSYFIRGFLLDDPENDFTSKKYYFSTPPVVNIKNSEVKVDENITVRSRLGLNGKSSNPFLHVKAFYKEVDVDGNLSDLVPIKFTGNDEEPLAFFDNKYTDGIYIDIDRVKYSDFSMNFSYPEGITSEEQVSDYLYFITSSISEPVYRYQISESKLIAALNSGVSDPVITYTNIQNGFGLFGTSAGRLDSIKIK